jgi:hypothetical protein
MAFLTLCKSARVIVLLYREDGKDEISHTLWQRFVVARLVCLWVWLFGDWAAKMVLMNGATVLMTM